MKLKNVLRNNNSSFRLGLVLLGLGVLIFLIQKLVTIFNKKVEILPSPAPEVEQLASVTKIVDGDTIVLSTGEEVRYIGIDTPEENNSCYATEASKINSDLVLGKEIKLTKDTSETDKYGRLLRYVYVGNVFVNDYLVKNGYAKVLAIDPDTKYKNNFIESEKFAKENSLGLWGKCAK